MVRMQGHRSRKGLDLPEALEGDFPLCSCVGGTGGGDVVTDRAEGLIRPTRQEDEKEPPVPKGFVRQYQQRNLKLPF